MKKKEEEDELKNASDGKAAPARPVRQWHSRAGTPSKGGKKGIFQSQRWLQNLQQNQKLKKIKKGGRGRDAF